MPNEWELKHAEEKKHFNLALAREAMRLVYGTYIVDKELANTRADAIQAIDRMIVGFGAESFIPEMEQ